MVSCKFQSYDSLSYRSLADMNDDSFQSEQIAVTDIVAHGLNIQVGSATDMECHARVGPILKLARLKENKLFLSTKACKHLLLFNSGPILSVILPYCRFLILGLKLLLGRRSGLCFSLL